MPRPAKRMSVVPQGKEVRRQPVQARAAVDLQIWDSLAQQLPRMQRSGKNPVSPDSVLNLVTREHSRVRPAQADRQARAWAGQEQAAVVLAEAVQVEVWDGS